MYHSILCPRCNGNPCRCYWAPPIFPDMHKLYPYELTKADSEALKPLLDSVKKAVKKMEPTWEERLDWQLNEYREWLNNKLGNDLDAPI